MKTTTKQRAPKGGIKGRVNGELRTYKGGQLLPANFCPLRAPKGGIEIVLGDGTVRRYRGGQILPSSYYLLAELPAPLPSDEVDNVTFYRRALARAEEELGRIGGLYPTGGIEVIRAREWYDLALETLCLFSAKA